MRWDDESIPMIFVTEYHCPSCFATKPLILRTLDGRDGSRSRRCICRSCSMRWILVIEPPCQDLADGADTLQQ